MVKCGSNKEYHGKYCWLYLAKQIILSGIKENDTSFLNSTWHNFLLNTIDEVVAYQDKQSRTQNVQAYF